MSVVTVNLLPFPEMTLVLCLVSIKRPCCFICLASGAEKLLNNSRSSGRPCFPYYNKGADLGDQQTHRYNFRVEDQYAKKGFWYIFAKLAICKPAQP
jgi:hypothetical protein